MFSKQYKFTSKQLAEACGISVKKVYRDIHKGILDPNSVYSVAKYVFIQLWLKKKA